VKDYNEKRSAVSSRQSADSLRSQRRKKKEELWWRSGASHFTEQGKAL